MNNIDTLEPAIILSVIMPVHKFDEFVDLSVKSVLDHLPEKSELLIVVNGAATSDKEKQHSLLSLSPKVKLLTSESNGIVSALNLGIENSSGQFLARMDHDDIVLNDRFNRQLNFFRQNRDVGILGTDVVEIDAQGIFIKQWGLQLKIKNNLINPVFSRVAHPSVMMRKELILKIGGYRELFEKTEDHDLWSRAMKITKVQNLGSVGLGYRIHSGQISGNFDIEKSINTLRSYLYNELSDFSEHNILFNELIKLRTLNEFQSFVKSLKIKSPIKKLRIYSSLKYWNFINSLKASKEIKVRWVAQNFYFFFIYFLKNSRAIRIKLLGQRRLYFETFNNLFH